MSVILKIQNLITNITINDIENFTDEITYY